LATVFGRSLVSRLRSDIIYYLPLPERHHHHERRGVDRAFAVAAAEALAVADAEVEGCHFAGDPDALDVLAPS
jgi:hypothetical protein